MKAGSFGGSEVSLCQFGEKQKDWQATVGVETFEKRVIDLIKSLHSLDPRAAGLSEQVSPQIRDYNQRNKHQ